MIKIRIDDCVIHLINIAMPFFVFRVAHTRKLYNFEVKEEEAYDNISKSNTTDNKNKRLGKKSGNGVCEK